MNSDLDDAFSGAYVAFFSHPLRESTSKKVYLEKKIRKNKPVVVEELSGATSALEVKPS